LAGLEGSDFGSVEQERKRNRVIAGYRE